MKTKLKAFCQSALRVFALVGMFALPQVATAWTYVPLTDPATSSQTTYNWSDKGSWKNGAVPAANDAVQFDTPSQGGVRVVDIQGGPTAQIGQIIDTTSKVTLQNGTVLFNSSGGDLSRPWWIRNNGVLSTYKDLTVTFIMRGTKYPVILLDGNSQTTFDNVTFSSGSSEIPPNIAFYEAQNALENAKLTFSNTDTTIMNIQSSSVTGGRQRYLNFENSLVRMSSWGKNYDGTKEGTGAASNDKIDITVKLGAKNNDTTAAIQVSGTMAFSSSCTSTLTIDANGMGVGTYHILRAGAMTNPDKLSITLKNGNTTIGTSVTSPTKIQTIYGQTGHCQYIGASGGKHYSLFSPDGKSVILSITPKQWTFADLKDGNVTKGYQITGGNLGVGEKVDVYTSSSTWTVPSGTSKIDILAVGGGAAGGCKGTDPKYSGGGGGAGGYVYKPGQDVTGGHTVTICVGKGGAPSSTSVTVSQDGGDSTVTDSGNTFAAVTAYGGGAGGGYYSADPKAARQGASGGGAVKDVNGADSNHTDQGKNGGHGNYYPKSPDFNGGGGGGAGTAGDSAYGIEGVYSYGNGTGNGGTGSRCAITGVATYYAGGGGGGSGASSPHGAGGAGGGGCGSSGTGGVPMAGADGYGGGGGGAGNNENTAQAGGKGGDGVVIIRYTVNTYYWAETDSTDHWIPKYYGGWFDDEARSSRRADYPNSETADVYVGFSGSSMKQGIQVDSAYQLGRLTMEGGTVRLGIEGTGTLQFPSGNSATTPIILNNKGTLRLERLHLTGNGEIQCASGTTTDFGIVPIASGNNIGVSAAGGATVGVYANSSSYYTQLNLTSLKTTSSGNVNLTVSNTVVNMSSTSTALGGSSGALKMNLILDKFNAANKSDAILSAPGGTLTFAGGSTLDVEMKSAVDTGTYTLIKYGACSTAANLTVGTLKLPGGDVTVSKNLDALGAKAVSGVSGDYSYVLQHSGNALTLTLTDKNKWYWSVAHPSAAWKNSLWYYNQDRAGGFRSGSPNSDDADVYVGHPTNVTETIKLYYSSRDEFKLRRLTMEGGEMRIGVEAGTLNFADATTTPNIVNKKGTLILSYMYLKGRGVIQTAAGATTWFGTVIASSGADFGIVNDLADGEQATNYFTPRITDDKVKPMVFSYLRSGAAGSTLNLNVSNTCVHLTSPLSGGVASGGAGRLVMTFTVDTLNERDKKHASGFDTTTVMLDVDGTLDVAAGSTLALDASRVGRGTYDIIRYGACSTAGNLTITSLTLPGGAAATIPAGTTLDSLGTTAVSGTTAVAGVGDCCYCLKRTDGLLTLTILKMVATPTAVTGLVYDGNSKTGVAAAEGYTVSDGVKTNAGNYNATATLNSGYCWTDGTTNAATVPWSIAVKPVTPTVTLTKASATYGDTDWNVLPTVESVKDGDTALAATDYDAVWDDATVPAGVCTRTMTVTLKGNYSGSNTATYTISKASISTATAAVTNPEKIEYTGSDLTITFAVTDGDGRVLTEGTDYDVELPNRVGQEATSTEYVATITGRGNYAGTLTVPYTILGRTFVWVGDADGRGEWKDTNCWDRVGTGVPNRCPSQYAKIADGQRDIVKFTNGAFRVVLKTQETDKQKWWVKRIELQDETAVTFVGATGNRYIDSFEYSAVRGVVRLEGTSNGNYPVCFGGDNGYGTYPSIFGELHMSGAKGHPFGTACLFDGNDGACPLLAATGCTIAQKTNKDEESEFITYCCTNDNLAVCIAMTNTLWRTTCGTRDANAIGTNATLTYCNSTNLTGIIANHFGGSVVIDDSVVGYQNLHGTVAAAAGHLPGGATAEGDTFRAKGLAFSGARAKLALSENAAVSGPVAFTLPAGGFANTVGMLTYHEDGKVDFSIDMSFAGVAPLAVVSNLDLTAVTKLTVDATAIAEPGTYPLVAAGSLTGVAGLDIAVTTQQGLSGGVQHEGNKLNLVIWQTCEVAALIVQSGNEITTNRYTTLEDAFTAAKDGANVTNVVMLLTNVVTKSVSVTKDVTFQGDVWEVALPKFTVSSGKTLTIAGGYIGVDAIDGEGQYHITGGKYVTNTTFNVASGYHYAKLASIVQLYYTYSYQVIAGAAQDVPQDEVVLPALKGSANDYVGEIRYTLKDLEEKGITGTMAEIVTNLNTIGANKNRHWENLVLGLSHTNANAVAVLSALQTSKPDKLTLKLDGLNIDEKAGATVRCRVMYTDKEDKTEWKTDGKYYSPAQIAEQNLPTSGVRYYRVEIEVIPAK